MNTRAVSLINLVPAHTGYPEIRKTEFVVDAVAAVLLLVQRMAGFIACLRNLFQVPEFILKMSMPFKLLKTDEVLKIREKSLNYKLWSLITACWNCLYF